jgi:hypothetical protein
LRVNLLDDLGEPALGRDLQGLAGVHDVHRPEVRAAGVLVADPLDDSDIAGQVQVAERRRGRVERQGVRERQGLALRHMHQRAGVVVVAVLERDDRVQEVVAARKLHDDQDRVLLLHPIAIRVNCHAAMFLRTAPVAAWSRAVQIKRTGTRESP